MRFYFSMWSSINLLPHQVVTLDIWLLGMQQWNLYKTDSGEVKMSSKLLILDVGDWTLVFAIEWGTTAVEFDANK